MLAIVGCTEGTSALGVLERPIISGQQSGPDDFPTTGAIVVFAQTFQGPQGGFSCTGTLIAPDVVLTAGHCVEVPPQARSFTLYFTLTRDVSDYGAPQFQLPARTVEVRRFEAHPGWRGIQQMGQPRGLGEHDDIALLYLDTPIDDVAPAALADPEMADEIFRGAVVQIAGYGQRTTEMPRPGMRPPPSGVQFHATSEIADVGEAEMQVGTVFPTPQKCHGDSGGPSYMDIDDGRLPRRRLVGVTSRGYNDDSDCEVGGVDTRVDHYWSWIDESMRRACTMGDRSHCADGGGPVRPEVPAPDAEVVEPEPPDAGEPEPRPPDAGVAEPPVPTPGWPDASPDAPDANLPDDDPSCDDCEGPILIDDGGLRSRSDARVISVHDREPDGCIAIPGSPSGRLSLWFVALAAAFFRRRFRSK